MATGDGDSPDIGNSKTQNYNLIKAKRPGKSQYLKNKGLVDDQAANALMNDIDNIGQSNPDDEPHQFAAAFNGVMASAAGSKLH